MRLVEHTGSIVAVVLVTSCVGDAAAPTEFDASSATDREARGKETVIAASGTMGAGTMDLGAEVLLRPADGNGFGDPIEEGGVFTVEERICRSAPRNRAHPDGERCRWRVYRVPEDSFGELAGRTLRNVPNDGFLFLFDVPVTSLRITYRARGTKGASNVRNCPWIPLEFTYFCSSDGSVDFGSAEQAARAHEVMRQMGPRLEP